MSTGYVVDDMVEILAGYEWLSADAADFEKWIVRHGAHGRTDGASATVWFDKVGDAVAWHVTLNTGRNRYVRRTYEPPVAEQ